VLLAEDYIVGMRVIVTREAQASSELVRLRDLLDWLQIRASIDESE
jgi:hypothetical protein